MEERLLLNETTKISSDILFYNLNVSGNVTFDRLIINNTEVDLGDLLLRTDENVVITGTKTFLKNVEMRSNVTITSGMINGHHVDEFVTLDTDQVFPSMTFDYSFNNELTIVSRTFYILHVWTTFFRFKKDICQRHFRKRDVWSNKEIGEILQGEQFHRLLEQNCYIRVSCHRRTTDFRQVEQ